MKADQPTPASFRIAAVAGGVAMLLAGWALGGRLNETPGSDGSGGSDGKIEERDVRPYGKYRTPGHALSRVAAIRDLETPGEQLRATIALANSLPISELADWLDGRWFDNTGDYNLSMFNKIAERRWEQEDPDGYAEWKIRQGGSKGREILAGWARSDPDRLVAYFREHPNVQQELFQLRTMAESHPEVAIKRVMELIERGIAPNTSERYQVGEVLAKIAETDPARAAKLAESLPLQYARELEKGLVAQSLNQSFSAGLADLTTRADGWDLLLNASVSDKGSKLLAELASLPDGWKGRLAEQPYGFIDSRNAKQWLDADMAAAGFTDDQIRSISSHALRYIARSDPDTALAKMNELGLEGDDRRNMLINMLGNADAGKVERLMGQLQDPEEIELAQGMLDNYRTQVASARPFQRPTSPSEWIEQVSSAGDGSGGRGVDYSMVSVLSNWDAEKLAEVSKGFAGLSDEMKSAVAESVANYGDEVAPSFRGEMIRYQMESAGSEGDGRFADSASWLAIEWMKQDADAAGNWVNSLPAGDERTWAQKNLARNWALYDPDAAQAWVNSLPSDSRAEVSAYLEEKK